MENEKRNELHKRSEEVERILAELNGLLKPVQDQLAPGFSKPSHATVFIMGCARSGTTLAYQLMAKHLDCVYPSNFISRFYYSPYAGALYQKLMYDLDSKGELLNRAGS